MAEGPAPSKRSRIAHTFKVPYKRITKDDEKYWRCLNLNDNPSCTPSGPCEYVAAYLEEGERPVCDPRFSEDSGPHSVGVNLSSDKFLQLSTLDWIERETAYAQQRCTHVLKFAIAKRRDFANLESQNIIFLMAMVARLTYPCRDILSDPGFPSPPGVDCFASTCHDAGALLEDYNHWHEVALRGVYDERWRQSRVPRDSGRLESSLCSRVLALLATNDQELLWTQSDVSIVDEMREAQFVKPTRNSAYSSQATFHESMVNITLDTIAMWLDDIMPEGCMPRDTAEGVFSYQLLHLHFMKGSPQAKKLHKLHSSMTRLMERVPHTLINSQDALTRKDKELLGPTTADFTLQWVTSNAVKTPCSVGNCRTPDSIVAPNVLVRWGLDMLKLGSPDFLDELLQRGTRFDRRHCLMNQAEDEVYFITHIVLTATWWGSRPIQYPSRQSEDFSLWAKLARVLTMWLTDLLPSSPHLARVETNNREVALEVACCLLILCLNDVQIPPQAYDLCFKYMIILQLHSRYRRPVRFARPGHKYTTYVGYYPCGRHRLHIDYHTHILLSMFLQVYRLCGQAGKLPRVLTKIYLYDSSSIRKEYRKLLFHDWRRTRDGHDRRKRKKDGSEEDDADDDEEEEEEEEEVSSSTVDSDEEVPIALLQQRHQAKTKRKPGRPHKISQTNGNGNSNSNGNGVHKHPPEKRPRGRPRKTPIEPEAKPEPKTSSDENTATDSSSEDSASSSSSSSSSASTSSSSSSSGSDSDESSTTTTSSDDEDSDDGNSSNGSNGSFPSASAAGAAGGGEGKKKKATSDDSDDDCVFCRQGVACVCGQKFCAPCLAKHTPLCRKRVRRGFVANGRLTPPRSL